MKVFCYVGLNFINFAGRFGFSLLSFWYGGNLEGCSLIPYLKLHNHSVRLPTTKRLEWFCSICCSPGHEFLSSSR